MPTPIGHGLASLTLGVPVRRAWWVMALLGMAPDLDLLWGRHSMETHSVGAAIIIGLVAWGMSRDRRLALVVSMVWVAHPLLDALGEDSSMPQGVMLWWPLSTRHVIAPFPIFDSVYRAYWRPDFWPHMVPAVAKEIAILAPLTALAWFWRRRASSTEIGR